MNYIEGFDLSAAQGPSFPWGLVAAQMPEIRFCLVQATQRDWKDSCYARNMREAEHIGIVRSSYHVAHPALDAKKQARLYYDTAFQDSQLPPALDLELHKGHEEDPDQTPAQVREWTRDWVDETKLLWKCESVLLYSYSDYWSNWLKGDLMDTSDCAFWWARYEAQTPGRNCQVWQYSDGKKIKTPWGAGIDRNRFMGDEEDFRAWVGNGGVFHV